VACQGVIGNKSSERHYSSKDPSWISNAVSSPDASF
jgi:hypothetical protein